MLLQELHTVRLTRELVDTYVLQGHKVRVKAHSLEHLDFTQ